MIRVMQVMMVGFWLCRSKVGVLVVQVKVGQSFAYHCIAVSLGTLVEVLLICDETRWFDRQSDTGEKSCSVVRSEIVDGQW